MAAEPTPPRVALLAGSTGLVGRALLPMLLASPRYAQVHALLRRAVPDLPASPKLQVQVVDFQLLPALPKVDDVFIALGPVNAMRGLTPEPVRPQGKARARPCASGTQRACNTALWPRRLRPCG